MSVFCFIGIVLICCSIQVKRSCLQAFIVFSEKSMTLILLRFKETSFTEFLKPQSEQEIYFFAKGLTGDVNSHATSTCSMWFWKLKPNCDPQVFPCAFSATRFFNHVPESGKK